MRPPTQPHPAGRVCSIPSVWKIDKAVHLARPPTDVFHFLRSPRNLPLLIPQLAQVEQDDAQHLRLSKAATRLTKWDVEVVCEKPGEAISWNARSSDGMRQVGCASFEPEKQGTGAVMKIRLEFEDTPSKADRAGAERELDGILAHLKMIVETDTDSVQAD